MSTQMTFEDALSFIPKEFIWAAALAFKSGMKESGYEKNGWIDNPPSLQQNLMSFLGHIEDSREGLHDSDSGYPACFHVAARAVMHVIISLRCGNEK